MLVVLLVPLLLVLMKLWFEIGVVCFSLGGVGLVVGVRFIILVVGDVVVVVAGVAGGDVVAFLVLILSFCCLVISGVLD